MPLRKEEAVTDQRKSTEEIAKEIQKDCYCHISSGKCLQHRIKLALDAERSEADHLKEGLGFAYADEKALEKKIATLESLAYLEGEPGHETTWKSEAELLLAHNAVLIEALKPFAGMFKDWRGINGNPMMIADPKKLEAAFNAIELPLSKSILRRQEAVERVISAAKVFVFNRSDETLFDLVIAVNNLEAHDGTR